MTNLFRSFTLGIMAIASFSSAYAACNSSQSPIGFRIQNNMPSNSQCPSGYIIQVVGPATEIMQGSVVENGTFTQPLSYQNMTNNDMALCYDTGANSVDGFSSLANVPVTIACSSNSGQSKTLYFPIGVNKGQLKVDTGSSYSAPCSTSISDKDGLLVQINSNCAAKLP